MSYEGEAEVDGCLVGFTATTECQYQRGRFSGPPEDCYPDDGECEITQIEITRVVDEEGKEVTDAARVAHCRAALDEDAIADTCWEIFMSPREDWI